MFHVNILLFYYFKIALPGYYRADSTKLPKSITGTLTRSLPLVIAADRVAAPNPPGFENRFILFRHRSKTRRGSNTFRFVGLAVPTER